MAKSEELPKIPRNARGRVLWDNIPGAIDWFKNVAPDMTNNELIEAIRGRYGVDVTIPSVNQMRLRKRVQQTPETIARGVAVRIAKIRGPQKPELTPQEKYDRDSMQASIRRLTAKQTFYEVVGDRVIQAVREIPKMPPVRIPRISVPKGLSEEEAVLVISDVQAGLTTSAKETGGLGDFNTAVLLKEIEYLAESVEAIMRYHTNVRTLNVWFNGDIVEGEDIFAGQLREIDMNLVEQVAFCVEHFARFIHRMAHRFETVRCTGTVGNHGRIGRKGEHSPMSNFDYLVYKWLAERTARATNVSWTIPETWWIINEIQGWRFLQVHGDDTGQSTWGIPFYSMQRHSWRYQEMLRLARQEGFDFIVIGHHSEAGEFKNVISAGSWPGGTEFSIKRMQALAMPSAPFFGVVRSHGKTWRRDIYLRPPKDAR